jgi:hypothetical protein
VDSVGNVIWTAIYGGPHDDEVGNSVVQTPDGGYLVAGYRRIDPSSLTRVWLLRTDAQGDTLWTQYFGPTSWQLASKIEMTPDSGYIVAGTVGSIGVDSGDVYLLRLGPVGGAGVAGTNSGAITDISATRCYPNPFTRTTTIKFSTATAGRVTLKIYNLLGQAVASLLDRHMPAGAHAVIWDAQHYSKGLYFCHVQTSDGPAIIRMLRAE